jgi:prevent-host-death family protein
MVRNMVMKVAVGEAKKRLCELVDRAEHGETVVILRHGRPIARLAPMPGRGKPWRVEVPDNPALYKGIDLNAPILDEI